MSDKIVLKLKINTELAAIIKRHKSNLKECAKTLGVSATVLYNIRNDNEDRVTLTKINFIFDNLSKLDTDLQMKREETASALAMLDTYVKSVQDILDTELPDDEVELILGVDPARARLALEYKDVNELKSMYESIQRCKPS